MLLLGDRSMAYDDVLGSGVRRNFGVAAMSLRRGAHSCATCPEGHRGARWAFLVALLAAISIGQPGCGPDRVEDRVHPEEQKSQAGAPVVDGLSRSQKETIDAMRKLVDLPAGQERYTLIHRLERVRKDDRRVALLWLLAHTSGAELTAVVDLVGGFGQDVPELLAPLREAATTGDTWGTRLAGADIYRLLGGRDGRDLLITTMRLAFESGDAAASTIAANVIGNDVVAARAVGAQPGLCRDEFLAPIRALLDSTGRNRVLVAAQAIAGYRERGAPAAPNLARALGRVGIEEQIATVLIGLGIEGRTALPDLLALLDRENGAGRQRIVEIIGAIGCEEDEDALKALEDLAQATEASDLREAARRALMEVRGRPCPGGK